jgi:hypothetical protein
MNTRSQSNYDKCALYEVNIDFDEASKAWKQNKKQVEQGHFQYICTVVKQDGTKCGKTCSNTNGTEGQYCRTHKKCNKDSE